MSKYRFGWPDLLLVLAYWPALTGHGYVVIAMLGLYAWLYNGSTHRRQG